jgi:hypothetical protein
LRSKSLYNILSGERMGLLLTISAGTLRRSHSRVPATQDSWPYFTVSYSRLPQPGGPGPRIYIPLGQGGSVIPLGTWFLFVASYNSQGYSGGIRPRLPESESKSELLYYWRFTANEFVLVTSSLRLMTSNFISNWSLAVIVLM